MNLLDLLITFQKLAKIIPKYDENTCVTKDILENIFEILNEIIFFGRGDTVDEILVNQLGSDYKTYFSTEDRFFSYSISATMDDIEDISIHLRPEEKIYQKDIIEKKSHDFSLFDYLSFIWTTLNDILLEYQIIRHVFSTTYDTYYIYVGDVHCKQLCEFFIKRNFVLQFKQNAPCDEDGMPQNKCVDIRELNI